MKKSKKLSEFFPLLYFNMSRFRKLCSLYACAKKIINAQSTTGDFMSLTREKPTALSANIRTYALKMSANLKR